MGICRNGTKLLGDSETRVQTNVGFSWYVCVSWFIKQSSEFFQRAIRVHFCHWKVLDTHLAHEFLSQLYYNQSLLTTLFHPYMIDYISTYYVTVIALSYFLRNAGHPDWIFSNFPATSISSFALLPLMDNFIHCTYILLVWLCQGWYSSIMTSGITTHSSFNSI